MNTLTLKKYFVEQLSGVKHGNRGDRKVNNSFIEFYIDDRPLSSLLDSLYSLDGKSILEDSVGVLGSFHNIPLDIIKVKQLIGRKFTDADFFELKDGLARVRDESYIADRIDRIKDELADPEIMIYCCAQCGDYFCGGVMVDVRFDEQYVTWTYNNESQKTVFTFDKYVYLATLKSYLSKIKLSLSKQ